ncbi:RagB/SusD family nutrient uptake outer membrane protein [Compostibacter hankyongensis]|uniref:RagB/SusD family nutrient uptake outer membrane protein n=1 Tax=Compostibacter hankyongensis TaxID=1007089 RepID=A0ABP8FIB7_9BACT
MKSNKSASACKKGNLLMRPASRLALLLMVVAALLPVSCSKDYLDRAPRGGIEGTTLNNKKSVDALLIGAYAALDGQNVGAANPWESSPDNWIYGSVAGGDAHKGSDGTDQPAIIPIANFNSDPSNGFFNSKWVAVYEGISRTNLVLQKAKLAEDMTDEERTGANAEARFLRGYYYFDLKKMFNMVPWISDTTNGYNVSNEKDIWPLIEADFKFAMDSLPETQPEVGRANKWAAEAFLAKTYLYQHKYAEAKTLFDEVIAKGQTSNGLRYALTQKFEDNFDAAAKNNSESVFAIQMVANDGTNGIANANQGDMLNFPYGNSPFGCCGFYQPTQDLVNSYRTDAAGLPYLDDYNQHAVKSDMGVPSDKAFTPDNGNLDPRLDWTAGRRGIPYHDWGLHPGRDWIRDQNYSGPYAPKKNVYWQYNEDKYHDANSWAPGSAINVVVMRFADVLLMAAECEAQLNNLAKAETYVNQVRNRAANTAGWLYKYKDNAKPLDGFSTTPAAHYVIKPYPGGAFTTKAYALKAIYFERKLELAMEGQRFFDLVRWGIAATALNNFFAYEGKLTSDIRNGHFNSGKNDYYPIPQTQIDRSSVNGTATLKQNPGY